MDRKISFYVSKQTQLEINIYNILGVLVNKFIINTHSPGHYNIVWNGTNINDIPVSSGVYFYQMKTDDVFITKKMILLK